MKHLVLHCNTLPHTPYWAAVCIVSCITSHSTCFGVCGRGYKTPPLSLSGDGGHVEDVCLILHQTSDHTRPRQAVQLHIIKDAGTRGFYTGNFSDVVHLEADWMVAACVLQCRSDIDCTVVVPSSADRGQGGSWGEVGDKCTDKDQSGDNSLYVG